MEAKPILLVEDNPDDVELTLRAFKKCNIVGQIQVIHDGAEALDYLYGLGSYAGQGMNQMPRMILLDLNLPKLDGLEVLRRIRANVRTQLLPVVVFTSSQKERDVIDSYRVGANSFIRKPVDSHQFMQVIEWLGRYWLSLNEPPPTHGGDL